MTPVLVLCIFVLEPGERFQVLRRSFLTGMISALGIFLKPNNSYARVFELLRFRTFTIRNDQNEGRAKKGNKKVAIKSLTSTSREINIFLKETDVYLLIMIIFSANTAIFMTGENRKTQSVVEAQLKRSEKRQKVAKTLSIE